MNLQGGALHGAGRGLFKSHPATGVKSAELLRLGERLTAPPPPIRAATVVAPGEVFAFEVHPAVLAKFAKQREMLRLHQPATLTGLSIMAWTMPPSTPRT